MDGGPPKMFYIEVIVLLCVAVTFTPGHCQTKSSSKGDPGRARLPEFLSELDLSSLEASEEDVEALKKIVKRLAPEKNGEYQVYQGVTGQPGVDFPALTSIPATSFSCRGLKGGYYADLETNCQVFHICDNGRKISFLCPNGTIFQQSQLICDWWFKVDCSKSTELYEQSAEQLAEEERKRAESKKIKSEFHHNVNKDNTQNYYDTQSTEYDGRQNGRTNPYGQSPKQNQLREKQEGGKQIPRSGSSSLSTQQSNEKEGNQFFQVNRFQSNTERPQANDQFSQKQKQQQGFFLNNYRSIDRQRNQLPTDPQNKYNQFDASRVQASRTQEKPLSRTPKSRNSTRNSLTDFEQPFPKVTPAAYTETTTFRTTTGNPVKEFQQFAESAAFVSNRGNRFGVKPNSNSNQFYYQVYQNSNAGSGESTTTVSSFNDKYERSFRLDRTNVPPFPGPTFSPIYKPKTTMSSTAEASTHPTTPLSFETTLRYDVTAGSPSTGRNYDNTDYYGQEYSLSTVNPAVDAITITPYSTQDYKGNTELPGSSENFENLQEDREIYGTSTKKYIDANSYGTTGTGSEITDTFSTTRFSLNTVTESDQDPAVTSSATYLSRGDNTAEMESRTDEFDSRADSIQIDSRISTKNPEYRTSPNYQQNVISSTEKPPRSIQPSRQNSVNAGRTLSPYDTSFTYKQGKVMSTLGPYVPFTKNYVYSVTPTPNAATTSSTVASYNGVTVEEHRSTVKNLIPKIRPSSSPNDSTKVKGGSAYLPEVKDISNKKRPVLDSRPPNEREHVLGMLNSLRGLEGVTGLDNNDSIKVAASTSNLPISSGPSTLHSLALYFATASDSFDSNETADTADDIRTRSSDGNSAEMKNTTVELPTSILTQHTITSYAELFNLNNALESNVTTENRFGSSDEEDVSDNEENDDDLDVGQSGGPVDTSKKSNGTKLRELAQVFTHALSAYLEDPDTFKKVLTEIRPTEPPTTTSSDGSNEEWETTTYPTTIDEYPSVTKEKDEVLNFSDEANAPRKWKPIATTTGKYPTTTEPYNLETTHQTYHTSSDNYHRSTPLTWIQYSQGPVSTVSAFDTDRTEYTETTTQSTGNTFASEVNHAFGIADANEIRNYDNAVSEPSAVSQTYGNDYQMDYGDVRNRIGGFQNNTVANGGTQGKNDGFRVSPISDSIAISSTAAPYVATLQTNVYGWNKNYASRIPERDLTPPFLAGQYVGLSSRSPINSEVSNDLSNPNLRSTTPMPKRNYDVPTTHPFRIRYETTAYSPSRRDDSIVTSRSSYTSFRNSYNRIEGKTEKSTVSPAAVITTTTTTAPRTTISPKILDPVTTVGDGDNASYGNTVIRDATTKEHVNSTTNKYISLLSSDHWTSSPMVTQLWETTVFVDPKRINHGLESEHETTTRSTVVDDYDKTAIRDTTTSYPVYETTTDASSETLRSHNLNTDLPTPWQWAPNNDDSPTAFTLLPTTFSGENTATPTPIITTRSSITTTITSSVTSTNAIPRENIVPSLLPSYAAVSSSSPNITENEIAKAQEMFGKLNVTSTDTLMRVMKQADSNETVRQLVLLLINHCDGTKNKTKEEEKERLLNALLKMPVNEFNSGESREIVAEINRLNLPDDNRNFTDVKTRVSSGVTISTEPSVTTYRSKKNRKFRTTTTSPSETSFSRRSDGSATGTENSLSLSDEETVASDGRALELLRSLYTIAAKWG